jgi:hypothetical protein
VHIAVDPDTTVEVRLPADALAEAELPPAPPLEDSVTLTDGWFGQMPEGGAGPAPEGEDGEDDDPEEGDPTLGVNAADLKRRIDGDEEPG